MVDAGRRVRFWPVAETIKEAAATRCLEQGGWDGNHGDGNRSLTING